MPTRGITAASCDLEAGAPEIEITPEMIEAGQKYLEETGVNSLTSMTTYPDFVAGFIRAVLTAAKPCGAASP